MVVDRAKMMEASAIVPNLFLILILWVVKPLFLFTNGEGRNVHNSEIFFVLIISHCSQIYIIEKIADAAKESNCFTIFWVDLHIQFFKFNGQNTTVNPQCKELYTKLRIKIPPIVKEKQPVYTRDEDS